MFDPKLYREACRELTAPQEKIEEIITMTEKTNQKHRRPLRTVMIAAAAVAVMVVGVSAANTESVQEFLYNIVASVKVGDFRQDMTTQDGEQVRVFSIPDAAVENRDGRAILVVGEDEVDITDELERAGQYTYRRSDEGSELSVLVHGSAEQWDIDISISAPGEEGLTYSVDSQGTLDRHQTNDGMSVTVFEDGMFKP